MHPRPTLFPLDIKALPGAEVVLQGIDDLKSSRPTPDACLASIAWPRLVECGLVDPKFLTPLQEPEHLLYKLLCQSHHDPYGAYKSWLRRLSRFEHALDQHRRH